jgi:integrase
VRHLETLKGGKNLKEAVEEFLLEAKSEGAGERYRQSLKVRLGKLVAAMPPAYTTAEVTADKLATFLLAYEAAETKRSYKANIKTFFNWCLTKNYCASNPADRLKKIKGKDHKPEILLPEELAKLLGNCDDSILPGVVLGAFCGVRQAEIGRLDWTAIDLEEKIVTIDGSIAKTGSRRTIQIPDNAVDWLTPLAQKKGAIWPAGEEYRRPWNIARLRCGWGPFQSTCAAVNAVQNKMTKAQLKKLKPWPENALRHSFISYKLAKTRDLAEVATEAGNSPNMVKKHYLHLVKPTASETWFAIRPAAVASGKVARFSKAKAA